MHKPSFTDSLLAIVSLGIYFLLGYFIPRYETLPLFVAYGSLFLIYVWIIRSDSENTVSFWLISSFFFRSCFLLAWPQLSDDFYRFIWDGRLWASGHHPFAALPAEFLEQNIKGIDQQLYQHLNSKDYFTVYPPFAQYVFWLAVKIFPDSIVGSVIVMRVAILAFETGTLMLIMRLLHQFKLPRRHVLIYALNPLIILELTGNLHFEAIVIFFLLLSVYLLQKKRFAAAISFSVAICTKLIPIIFLPAFLGKFRFRELLIFYLVIALSCLLISLPYLDWAIINTGKSVGLYFNKFEFNASVYYLIREIGFVIYGYNIIQTVGWKLALMVLVLILIFIRLRNRQMQNSLKESDIHLFRDCMWIFSIYLLFTTTLHPWYISTLLVLSVFTSYRFVVVWSGMIFLTYAGYAKNSFQEVLWLTFFEYVVVITFLGYELWQRKNLSFFGEW